MQPRLIYPLSLPSPNLTAIQTRLEAAGYKVEQDDKDHLYRQIIQLLNGFEGMDWLFEESFLRLCSEAQIRKGRAFTLAELKTFAQPQAETPRFLEFFHQLVLQGVFLRGYRLDCPACGLSLWYEPTQISETLRCRGCLAVFQPPLELPFAYQTNSLFTKGLNNGVTTVLLFLHQLRSVSTEAIWGAGYQVTKDGQTTDLDLVTLIGEVLTVVECKDDWLARDDAAVLTQIQQVSQVAENIGAAAFFLVTLKPEIPDLIQTFFQIESESVLRRLMGRRALLDSLKYWR